MNTPSLNRRSFATRSAALIAGAATLPAHMGGAHAATPGLLARTRRSHAASALAEPFVPFSRTASGREFQRLMATHFSLIVERSLAKASPAEVSARLRRWSPLELARLAAHWRSSNLLAGRAGKLLHILGEVAKPVELARLVPAFGVAEVSNALGQVDVGKLQAMSATLASGQSLGLQADTASLAGLTNGAGPLLDWTIEEIYLYYRTNPIGSLSVRAALWETGAFVGSRLMLAYAAGHAVGTGMKTFMELYMPDLYYAIGQKLYESIQKIHESTGTQPDLGDALYHAAEVVGVEEYVMGEAAVTDGDYQVAAGFGDSWCALRDSCLMLQRRREFELDRSSVW